MRRIVSAAMIAAALSLCACGGGGGDASSNSGSGGGGGGGGGGTTPSLTLSTSTLTFAASNLLTAPASQTVSATVTGVTSGTLYIRVVVTGTAVANVSEVTITGTSSGQATVIPQLPQVLGLGTHTSTITVTACTSGVECTSGIIGTPQTISVTYTVNAAQAQPATLSYIINPNSPDADFAKTLQITANPTWTLTTTFNGLALAPQNGTSANGTVTVTLGRAAADAMSAGITNTQILLTNGSGTQFSIPVSIDIRRPEISYASPHAEPSGVGNTTILRGSGLDLPGGFIGVNFVGPGGLTVPATSVLVSHAKEMRVQRPALIAGTYTVQVLNFAGVNVAKPSAKIVVVDPVTAPAGTVDYPADARARRISDLIYDAERSALIVALRYASDETTAQILRYTWNAGWSTPTARNLPYLWSVALLPDAAGWMATALINGASENAIVRCTSDFVTCDNHVQASSANIRRTAIGMTNDGEPIMLTVPLPTPPVNAGSIQRYSIPQDSVTGLAGATTYAGILTASEDGSAVLIGNQSAPNAVVQPLQVFRTTAYSGAGAFTPITEDVPITDRLAIDGRGAKAVVNGTLVYDTQTMSRIGMLPSTTRVAVLNRDGSRAYTWDQNGTVRIFNLNNLPATKMTEYPELTPAITPAGSPGVGPAPDIHLALTPDGRTLFMAGDSQIVVVPLP